MDPSRGRSSWQADNDEALRLPQRVEDSLTQVGTLAASEKCRPRAPARKVADDNRRCGHGAIDNGQRPTRFMPLERLFEYETLHHSHWR